jgi:hypothetical protein
MIRAGPHWAKADPKKEKTRIRQTRNVIFFIAFA